MHIDQRIAKSFASALALLLLGSSTAAQSRVWIVSPAGPFTQIQPAIDQAADGDTILVKSGGYAGFVIDDKRLNVSADTATTVLINGRVRVIGLAADRDAVLVGLQIKPPSGTTTNALEIQANLGSVRVEGCSIEGAFAATGGHGVFVENSEDVSLVRCSLRGGRSSLHSGGSGLSSISSKVALYECFLVGGAGGSYSCPCVARSGGSAASLFVTSFLFASRCTFQGGAGGNANNGCFGCSCGADGGQGGHGLGLYTGSTAKLLDDNLAGGAGGMKDCGVCGGCGGYDGPPGLPIAGSGATILAGQGRRLLAPNPVRELSTFVIDVHGQPGDAVFVVLSRASGFRWVPTYQGVQLTQSEARGRFLGTIGASGVLSRSLALEDLGPGEDSGNYFVQAAVRTASGAFVFSSAASLVVLDQSF